MLLVHMMFYFAFCLAPMSSGAASSIPFFSRLSLVQSYFCSVFVLVSYEISEEAMKVLTSYKEIAATVSEKEPTFMTTGLRAWANVRA